MMCWEYVEIVGLGIVYILYNPPNQHTISHEIH